VTRERFVAIIVLFINLTATSKAIIPVMDGVAYINVQKNPTVFVMNISVFKF
jgi:hypothetical protein